MLKGYLLKLSKPPYKVIEIIERLKNSKIKYVPFYEFSFENLKEKMCAEYDFYTNYKGEAVTRWFVTNEDAVTILISVGAVIVRSSANAGNCTR